MKNNSFLEALKKPLSKPVEADKRYVGFIKQQEVITKTVENDEGEHEFTYLQLTYELRDDENNVKDYNQCYSLNMLFILEEALRQRYPLGTQLMDALELAIKDKAEFEIYFIFRKVKTLTGFDNKRYMYLSKEAYDKAKAAEAESTETAEEKAAKFIKK